MKSDKKNTSFDRFSSETQRLIKGLEILKQKLDNISEPETTWNNKQENQS